MKSSLEKIIDGVNEKFNKLIQENGYDTLHFLVSPLSFNKAMKFTLILSYGNEEPLMFHQIIPSQFLTIQHEQQAIDYVFNCLMPTVKMIEQLDKQFLKEDEGKVSVKFTGSNN